jgi:hypothetical protein
LIDIDLSKYNEIIKPQQYFTLGECEPAKGLTMADIEKAVSLVKEMCPERTMQVPTGFDLKKLGFAESLILSSKEVLDICGLKIRVDEWLPPNRGVVINQTEGKVEMIIDLEAEA